MRQAEYFDSLRTASPMLRVAAFGRVNKGGKPFRPWVIIAARANTGQTASLSGLAPMARELAALTLARAAAYTRRFCAQYGFNRKQNHHCGCHRRFGSRAGADGAASAGPRSSGEAHPPGDHRDGPAAARARTGNFGAFGRVTGAHSRSDW